MSKSSAARVLHVDDDKQVRRDVSDYLASENLAGWGPPEITPLGTFSEALDELERTRYDLVILDVRADGGNGEDGDQEKDDVAGRSLLERIQERRYVPVVFFTGVAHAVEDLESHSVRIVSKPAGAEALVKEVRALFDTRLPVVNRALVRFIEDQQRDYMWNFVDANWGEVAVDGDHTAIAYLLARRIGRSLSGPLVSQLASTLGAAPGPLASDDCAHPIELYLVPPLPDAAPALGDILSGTVDPHGDGWWILLSPSCDLQPGRVKADQVLMARASLVTDLPAYQNWNKDKTKPPSNNFRDRLSNKTGGQEDRYLYLPRAATVPDLMVDFQQLVTVPFKTLEQLAHVATLDSPFAEAALNRFERYYGRMGVQDLDLDVAVERMRTL